MIFFFSISWSTQSIEEFHISLLKDKKERKPVREIGDKGWSLGRKPAKNRIDGTAKRLQSRKISANEV